MRVSARRFSGREPGAVSEQQAQGYIAAPLLLLLARPAFALRFVGQEALLPRMSDFDLGQFFSLTSDDVTAIRARFAATAGANGAVPNDCRRQQVGQSAVRVRAAISLQWVVSSSVRERGLAWL